MRVKSFCLLIITIISLLSCSEENYFKKSLRIGLVKGQFDRVDILLKKYAIDYSEIPYRDLEKKETYENYDVIFIPAGIDKSLKTSVAILSRGTRLSGMKADNYYVINYHKAARHFKDYISGGGFAYLSGYSVKLLQSAFDTYGFYSDFPNLGTVGSFVAYPEEEFANYNQVENIKININYNGWIILKDIIGGKKLLKGYPQTPLGKKEAVLLSLYNHDKGGVLFSSYYTQKMDNSISRFSILRTALSPVLKDIKNYVLKMEQNFNSSIVDGVLKKEEVGKYRINFKQGYNSLYFYADKGQWQIDVEDNDENLIYSIDRVGEKFVKNFYIKEPGKYLVKVYSEKNEINSKYILVSASGLRIFPYYKKALIGLLILALLLVYRFLLKNLFNRNKFAQRKTNYHRSNIS